MRVLQLANVFYIIFNLVCAFATTKGQVSPSLSTPSAFFDLTLLTTFDDPFLSQFIAFRFLAGLGGGAPLAIGAGVLSDLWRPEERGRAAALYSLGPLLGPGQLHSNQRFDNMDTPLTLPSRSYRTCVRSVGC